MSERLVARKLNKIQIFILGSSTDEVNAEPGDRGSALGGGSCIGHFPLYCLGDEITVNKKYKFLLFFFFFFFFFVNINIKILYLQ